MAYVYNPFTGKLDYYDDAPTDDDAIHDNVAGEIAAVTEKGSPVSGDLLLIEDSADSNNKKRVQVGNLPTGSDDDAIHDNVAGEINAITEKASPVNADLVIIEDSADSNNKKKVQVGNLPTAGGGESNTASNVGTAGVGVFKQKTGVDLEFKKVNAGSSKISVTDDVANDEVDVDVVEANLTLDNIGGTLGISKGGTGQTSKTPAFDALGPGTTKGDLIVHNGSDHVRFPAASDDWVLAPYSASAYGVRWVPPTWLFSSVHFVDRGDPSSWDFQVGDLTTDNTWRAMSFGSIAPVGTLALLIYCRLEDNLTNKQIRFRQSGNSNNNASSLLRTQVANLATDMTFVVPCNVTTRQIEYKATNTTFTTINICCLGWWIKSVDV